MTANISGATYLGTMFRITSRLRSPLTLDGNFAMRSEVSAHARRQQTYEALAEKWEKYGDSGEKERLSAFQCAWYLNLYGYESEGALRAHLVRCRVVFDAGCVLGCKPAWFAELARSKLWTQSEQLAELARRFSEEEVRALLPDNGLSEVFLHAEETCYSGRFAHTSASNGSSAHGR